MAFSEFLQVLVNTQALSSQLSRQAQQLGSTQFFHEPPSRPQSEQQQLTRFSSLAPLRTPAAGFVPVQTGLVREQLQIRSR